MFYKSKVRIYLLGINLVGMNLIGGTLLLISLRTRHMGDKVTASLSGIWSRKLGACAIPRPCEAQLVTWLSYQVLLAKTQCTLGTWSPLNSFLTILCSGVFEKENSHSLSCWAVIVWTHLGSLCSIFELLAHYSQVLSHLLPPQAHTLNHFMCNLPLSLGFIRTIRMLNKPKHTYWG